MTEKSKFGHFSSPNVQVTTLEGLLQRTITGLSQDQPIRRALHPDDAEKIDQYIEKVEQLLTVAKPFELTVVDPSGNSWVLVEAGRPGPNGGHHDRAATSMRIDPTRS